jgi:protein phosphatase
MNYTWASATHTGHVRDGNEDSMAPEHDGSGPGPLIAAVADGMGGHAAGEVASQLAIEAALEPVPNALDARSRVLRGNDAVLAAAAADAALAGMGTTLTLAIFHPDGHVEIGHIGDSRLYLLRAEELQQLTDDHTWVMEMVARGLLTEEAAVTHPRRHMVTRVIGMDDIQVDELELQVEAGDRVLVCSDGLNSMLDDYTIRSVLAGSPSASEAAWSLVEAANAAGGVDNTTVVVVDVGA